MSLADTYFQLAEEARAYVSETVTLGAGNKLLQRDTDGKEKTHMGLDVYQALEYNRQITGLAVLFTFGRFGFVSELLRHYKNENIITSPIGVEATCLGTQLFKAGNCQEQATLAYRFLTSKGQFPLEICHFENGDHVFVVIGRNVDSDIKNPRSWGENAIICDPWFRNFYAKDYQQWLEGLRLEGLHLPADSVINIEVLHSRQRSKLSFFVNSCLESASIHLLRSSLNALYYQAPTSLSGQSLFILSLGFVSMIRTFKQSSEQTPEEQTEKVRIVPH